MKEYLYNYCGFKLFAFHFLFSFLMLYNSLLYICWPGNSLDDTQLIVNICNFFSMYCFSFQNMSLSWKCTEKCNPIIKKQLFLWHKIVTITNMLLPIWEKRLKLSSASLQDLEVWYLQHHKVKYLSHWCYFLVINIGNFLLNFRLLSFTLWNFLFSFCASVV